MTARLEEMPNPFVDDVVTDAWATLRADVPSIHAEPFQQCLVGLANVERGARDSLLIHGPAGAGKTHLLARLQRHLRETAPKAADGAVRCIFIAVKLQANPHLLWQHLRRRFVSDLMQPHEGVTQLQRLVAHQLASPASGSPKSWVRNLRVLTQTDVGAVPEYLEQVARRLDISREVHVLVEHLVCQRFVTDALAALRGESLPEASLARLGLSPVEDEDREGAARRVVTDLCRLAGGTLPIVFCFDQIEALSNGEQQFDAFARFGRLAADLFEADENVFLISCIQSAFLKGLDEAVRRSDHDRAFKRRALLEPLTRAEAHELVRKRLEQSSDALRAARQGRTGNPVYPLEPAFVDGLCSSPKDALPRKVLARCAARFAELQTGRPPEARPVAGELEQAFAGRRHQALAAGVATDEVLLHGLPALWSVLGRKPVVTEAKGPSLALPVRDETVVVHVCDEANMKSLAARLRHVFDNFDPHTRTSVVRAPDNPITRAAKKARGYLDQFEKKGGRFVRPKAEALAALEALRSLLADARSGDLSHEGEPVPEGVVKAWLSSHLDAELAAFVGQLEGGGAAPDAALAALVRDVEAALAPGLVVEVSAVAGELGRSVEDVLVAARLAPERVGLLEGPPPVLFVRVPPERAGGRA
ncbi:MAG TPA: AAA family ATPase [Polyangiaceae bacterium]|nr:AAA family ATPase [Polyangiaceae bacterium]